MTAYNIAVTVGPNIFRKTNESAEGILDHGVYYDCFIRMIENYDEIFTIDAEKSYLNNNKVNNILDDVGRAAREKRK